jgi:hypothetical protein
MGVRKKAPYAAAMLAAVFLLQGCATVIRGTSQKIPVTSNPIGAKVIVDGKDMGPSPLTLRLKRKRPHVVRFELEGFNPHEIRIVRVGPSLSTVALMIMGHAAIVSPLVKPITLALGKNIEADNFWEALGEALLIMMAVDCALTGALTAGDFISGAPYSLSPETLLVALTPAGDTPHVETTEIGEAALRDVKWLRIRALDKPARRAD